MVYLDSELKLRNPHSPKIYFLPKNIGPCIWGAASLTVTSMCRYKIKLARFNCSLKKKLDNKPT